MKALQVLALAIAFALTGAGSDPAGAAGTFTRPTNPTKATCISTDGKKVCDCGTLTCWGAASTCGCIKPPPPPAPDPAPAGPKLKR